MDGVDRSFTRFIVRTGFVRERYLDHEGRDARRSRGVGGLRRVIAELSKKIQLKPQQVKNAFWIFVKATLENPTFSSQVKSECTSKVTEFGSKFQPPSKAYYKTF